MIPLFLVFSSTLYCDLSAISLDLGRAIPAKSPSDFLEEIFDREVDVYTSRTPVAGTRQPQCRQPVGGSFRDLPPIKQLPVRRQQAVPATPLPTLGLRKVRHGG